ncbi:MAG: hypothetical protein IJT54_03290 [Candidatus Methanomethylophilaceae archaeon]|jgi:hypothetical protein|nr:hypothetical protein [Candidatus Methanomethylophilaceae archaeon]
MAKKKRIIKQEAVEEEYEFVPPEFDEKEFILKDMYGTKVLLVVALMSVIIGILCSCLQRLSDSYGLYLGLALLFLAAFVQKKLLTLLGFKPDYLETKTMIGNYILFILLGLGVWILLINRPFM